MQIAGEVPAWENALGKVLFFHHFKTYQNWWKTYQKWLKKVWFSCYKSNKFVPRAAVLKREFFQLILQIHKLFPAQYSIYVQGCPKKQELRVFIFKKRLENGLDHIVLNFKWGRWSTFVSLDSSIYRKTMSNIWKYCLRNKWITVIWTQLEFSSRLSEIQSILVVLNLDLYEEKRQERGCSNPNPMVENSFDGPQNFFCMTSNWGLFKK